MEEKKIELEAFSYAIDAIQNCDDDMYSDWNHRKHEMIARITLAKNMNEYDLMEARNSGALNATLIMVAIYMVVLFAHFVI